MARYSVLGEQFGDVISDGGGGGAGKDGAVVAGQTARAQRARAHAPQSVILAHGHEVVAGREQRDGRAKAAHGPITVA